MSEFTDLEGRTWLFKVTFNSAAKVQKSTGINLLEALKPDSPLITELSSNPGMIASIVSVLLDSQFEERGVSADEFFEAVDDESKAVELMKALVEAIVSFFPPKKRDPILRAFRKIWNLTEERIEKHVSIETERLSNLDLEKVVDSIVAPIPGESGLNSPDISESNSGNTLSANSTG